MRSAIGTMDWALSSSHAAIQPYSYLAIQLSYCGGALAITPMFAIVAPLGMLGTPQT